MTCIDLTLDLVARRRALARAGRCLHATVYVSADLGELTTDARAVAYGRVVALEARWLDGRRGDRDAGDAGGGVLRKGDLGRTVTLRVPGGQMGPYRSVMLGAPTFVEGEEVVVFLAASGPAIPHLVGLAQGVFRVRTDVTTGARVVTPEIVRMPGIDAVAAGSRGSRRRHAGGRRRLPLPSRSARAGREGTVTCRVDSRGACSVWPRSPRSRRPRRPISSWART